MAHFNWFSYFLITALILNKTNPLNFPMIQDFTHYNEALDCNLVEYIAIIFEILVKDESYVRTFKLKIQYFLLFLFKWWLKVIIGSNIAYLTVILVGSKFHISLNQSRYFVLMETKVQFFSANWNIELYCDSLRIFTVNRWLPTLLACQQVACRVFRVLTRNAVYSKILLGHLNFELLF